MRYERNNDKYIVVMFAIFKIVFNIVLIYFARDYLGNHKFYLDAGHIYEIYSENIKNISFELMDSYTNIANVYRILFFNQRLSKEVFFVLASFLYILVYYFIVANIKFRNPNKFMIFSVIFFFDSVFLFQPCKELIVIFMNILILKLFKRQKRTKYLWVTLLLLFYAIFFRVYYFILILAIFGINIFVKNKKIRWWLVIAGMATFIVLYNKGLLNMLVDARVILDNNTSIEDIFPRENIRNNVFLFIINYGVSWLRLIFPIETIWKSPSRAILFIPVQMYFLYSIYKSIKHLIKLKKKEYRKSDLILRDCVIFIVAMSFVSALFEPDFGSYFRHEMGLLPFYMYIIFEADIYRYFPKRRLVLYKRKIV